ncbi:thermonuclease family protein [Bacillus sp. BRMEA1]|uniref:thermonuclease family protein n=1 Tax=Neobacillus endophyticus TaxID=2738405 RepID=UPI001563F5F6|nr:thermonuclease family protein [Neobacillus endophyticus]NRD79501.1 thermonuclease family protein [Neobacillus endophyticus]
MKKFFKTAIVAFLLLSLAACNQTNSANNHNKMEKSVDNTSKTEKPEADTKNTNDQSQTQTSNGQVPVTLVDAVDGDTIKVIYNGKEETVRYLLVDTPEEKKPNTCVQPYAVDAYNRNKQLLSNGNLTLEFDNGNKRDKYGRLLAYVFINGNSVQEELLKEGYARVAYIYEPTYKYLNEFRNDENLAKNRMLNIWSKPGYATDRGFIGCVNSSSTTSHSTSNTQTHSSPKSTNTTSTTSIDTGTVSGTTEFFSNCTELRKKYPNGVPKGHPAYQAKLDRDHDGYACER